MGELGDVLELVHRAPGEYRTVRATLRQWSHNERQQRAWERYRTEQRSTRSGGAQVAIARSGDPDAEPPIESEATVRIWHERPARTREERGDPSGTAVSVQYGSTWWHYSPALGAMSNEDDPSQGMDVGQQLDELFHPAPLLASTEVDVLGEVRQAARPAISVRARRRPVPRGLGHHGLDEAAQEHALLIDRERGFALRRAALFEGEEFWVTEVREIEFDVDFPPETFVFVPPEGEVVRSGFRLTARHLSIEEASREAPFRVFIPARVPDGFRMRMVTFLPGRERPGSVATVSLMYATELGTHNLAIRQTRAGQAAAWYGAPRLVEYEGRELRVIERRGGRSWSENQVFLERDGTAVTIASDLELDTLLELAVSLVPAPTEPPRLPS